MAGHPVVLSPEAFAVVKALAASKKIPLKAAVDALVRGAVGDTGTPGGVGPGPLTPEAMKVVKNEAKHRGESEAEALVHLVIYARNRKMALHKYQEFCKADKAASKEGK